MNVYDPMMQRTVVIQDTPREDGLSLAFPPSEFSDVTAAAHQLESAASARSFMQDQWRVISQNMNEVANVVCETV
ncbi:MAG: hypothetical protein J5838_07085 [Desulfovibrio sp.]|nr:hypothetical protein [Desulfovibrio sp.]